MVVIAGERKRIPVLQRVVAGLMGDNKKSSGGDRVDARDEAEANG